MRSLVPVPTAPPPLSRRERIVLLVLLPLWLPVFAIGVAVLLVVGLLFAPDPPIEAEPDADDDDDDLPDDYVPPFVPPRRQPPLVKAPVNALPPPRRISLVPAPPAISSTTTWPDDADELDQLPASSWPDRFPGG